MKIDLLIEKYFDGRATLEEEEELRLLIAEHGNSEKYGPVAAMLGFASTQKMARLENPDFDESTISKFKSKAHISKPNPFKRFSIIAGSAAASLILGTVLVYNIFYSGQGNTDIYKILPIEKSNVQEQDMNSQAMDILVEVSVKLNMGLEHLDKIQRLESEMDNLEKIDILNEEIKKEQNISEIRQ